MSLIQYCWYQLICIVLGSDPVTKAGIFVTRNSSTFDTLVLMVRIVLLHIVLECKMWEFPFLQKEKPCTLSMLSCLEICTTGLPHSMLNADRCRTIPIEFEFNDSNEDQ